MAAPRAVSPQSPAIRLHRAGQIRSSATPTSLRVRQAGVGRCCSAYAQRGPSVGYSNGAARTSAIALRRRRHRSDRRIRIAPLRSSGFAVYLRGFQSSQSPTRHRMIARSRNDRMPRGTRRQRCARWSQFARIPPSTDVDTDGCSSHSRHAYRLQRGARCG